MGSILKCWLYQNVKCLFSLFHRKSWKSKSFCNIMVNVMIHQQICHTFSKVVHFIEYNFFCYKGALQLFFLQLRTPFTFCSNQLGCYHTTTIWCLSVIITKKCDQVTEMDETEDVNLLTVIHFFKHSQLWFWQKNATWTRICFFCQSPCLVSVVAVIMIAGPEAVFWICMLPPCHRIKERSVCCKRKICSWFSSLQNYLFLWRHFLLWSISYHK